MDPRRFPGCCYSELCGDELHLHYKLLEAQRLVYTARCPGIQRFQWGIGNHPYLRVRVLRVVPEAPRLKQSER